MARRIAGLGSGIGFFLVSVMVVGSAAPPLGGMHLEREEYGEAVRWLSHRRSP